MNNDSDFRNGERRARRGRGVGRPSLENSPKVVVALDGSVGVQVNVAEQLHAHNRITEEKHHHQHHHVGKSLKYNK